MANTKQMTIDDIKLINWPGHDEGGVLVPIEVEKQIPLQQFEKALIERDGFVCNITGIPLLPKPPKSTFVKHLRMKSIDHRRPKLKRGKTELVNLQLLADYINERKKQICSICPDPKCDECVLAHPEDNDIVYPTGENISDIKRT